MGVRVPGHYPLTGAIGPELAGAVDNVRQTLGDQPGSSPSHACKKLCSVIFSLSMCGTLILSVAVGGIVTVTARGDRAECIRAGDGQGHGFWSPIAWAQMLIPLLSSYETQGN